MGEDLTAQAQALIARVRRDPVAAYEAALDLIQRAVVADQRLALANAYRAGGLAAKEQGDWATAVINLRNAIQAFACEQRSDLEAQARADLSVCLARQGDIEGAWHEIGQAGAIDGSANGGAVLMTRSLIAHMRGDEESSVADLGAAIEMFRKANDSEHLAQALSNRGLFEWERGRPAMAVAHLDEANAIYDSLDQRAVAAKIKHNRGLVYIAAQRVSEGLSLLSQADAELERLGVGRWTVLYDRCQVLIELGLADEAVALGRQTVRGLTNAAAQLELADMFFVLAGAALLTGETGHAGANALSAIRMFDKQGRADKARVARAFDDVVRILFEKLPADTIDPRVLALVEPNHLLVAAEYCFDFERLDDARVFASAAVKSLTDAPRTAANELILATAQAMICFVDGQYSFVTEAVHEGFLYAQRNAAVLGSVELRAAAMSSADRLGVLGVMGAIALDDNTEALLASEMARSLVPRMGTSVIKSTRELDQAIERLRRVEFALRMNDEPARQIQLVNERVGAEQQVRELTWQTAPGAVAIVDRFTVEALRAQVGSQAVVSFSRVGPDVVALVIEGADRPVTRVRVGDATEVRRIAENLRRALAAIAEGAGAGLGRRRLERSLGELNALLAPIVARLGDRDVIVVPDDGLDALPWQLLAGFAGRVVTLSSAASLWRPTQSQSYSVLRAAVGPGIVHGLREATDIAQRYPDRMVLAGSAASVDAVIATLGTADIVHLCAHGRFRSDNPLLSSLDLADGQLSIYDLMLQPVLPRLIVTSACDVGLGTLGAHSGVVGSAAALAGRGCERFVASVCTVRDDEATELMRSFHGRLSEGAVPERALAQAQQELIGQGALTVAGFTVVAVP